MVCLYAQTNDPKVYKAYNFHFPVNPNTTCVLTGNLGEIRPSHFHAGLDIAVDPNTKVHSSADGYISRIKVSSFGYGKVIYVTHPMQNLVTVYAHLTGFEGEIESFVKQKQYEKESYEIEITLPPQQLKVKRGQIIARTGNTGASAGPHLHYEIRTTKEVALNPFWFSFKELPKDNTPPIIQKIALTTTNLYSRVNGLFGSQVFNVVKKSKNQYIVPNPIQVWGAIGLEVLTHDLINGSSNTFGTTQITLKVDKKTIFTADLNRIDHTVNTSMNLHIDYRKMKQEGNGFQRCYVQDGNRLNVYQTNEHKGKIVIKDNQKHNVELILYDVLGNSTTLQLQLIGTTPNQNITNYIDYSPSQTKMSYEVWENTLVLRISYPKKVPKLNIAGIEYPLKPAFVQANQVVYLWDLRKGLPDFINLGNGRRMFDFYMLVPSNTSFLFKESDLEIVIPKQSLYDTLYLEVRKRDKSIEINNTLVPLFDSIRIAYSQTKQTNLCVLDAAGNTLHHYWHNNKIVFYTKRLGNHRNLKDTTPPTIKVIQKNAQKITLKITDDTAGISNYKAKLNGKFVLMEYEYKNNTLQSDLIKEKGQLLVEVWDKAGNKTQLNISI